ncbi:MAG: nitronate monooxygenase [Nannocystaceae bacterium]|nr:nitronate monooxygenase [Nannocystaceae bacterium]
MSHVLETAFTRHVGIEVPLICGATYPCSNPELVAAVSAAGGIGIIQPIAMRFVHGHELRAGIRLIRSMTDKPVGFNALIEASSKIYLERMRAWVDVALEEGVRFFVTALGNPRWVVDKVHAVGGVVYHDVTNRKWADKALDGGVDGLICVNARAGGHSGESDPRRLIDDLGDLGVPLVCAGGIGDEAAFADVLEQGYAAAQLGTRFIASEECLAHADYKGAILTAKEQDIVHTLRPSGVPVAVINTPHVQRTGTDAGWLGRRMLRHRRFKHWARSYYSLRSVWQLKRASLEGSRYQDFFQAGMSVDTIDKIEPAGEIVRSFGEAARARLASSADSP